MTAGRKGSEPLGRGSRTRCAGCVWDAHDCILVTDVEEAVVECESIRRIEIRCEREALLGNAVMVRVAENRDFSRTRLGEDDISVRGLQHSPGIIEIVGEDGN